MIKRLTTIAAVLLMMLAVTRTGRCDDLEDLTVPGKWIKPLVPEDAPEPQYPQYDKNNPVERARDQLWAGQYRRALVTLESARSGKPIDMALIRGEAELELGRYDAALATLGGSAVADDPAVQTLRARVQSAQGNYSGAIATLGKVIEKHPELWAPHYELGQCREQLGDIAGALEAYRWFVTAPHDYLSQWKKDPKLFDSAADVVVLGRAVDRWATLSLAYQDQVRLHDVVLGMFVRAYDLIDRDYWPAHVDAAEYFLLHDNTQAAQTELKQAMNANPFDIRSWKLIGQMQLDAFNFDGVDQAVAKIRDVNPNSVDADILEARNLLLQRVPQLALEPLQRVLASQPRNIEALGLEAGAYALLLQDAQSEKILKQVDGIDPSNALAYLEVADQLAAMRQYPRAEQMYQIAVKRAPWWSAPRNGLGILYTQSGDEGSARAVLESAHLLDPYNARTTNYLRLLDMMDQFASKESAHFIVRYDAKLDPIIPQYFSDYLESVYPAVCGEYRYEPKVKTYIEVFPTHDAFSVRTTGAPWIATVGASTGRVIALVAPRKGERTMGPFNWSQVLRHEFTHTVTLGATDNRIAHWFTEGLAVQQEHSPLRWEWVPMLYDAVTHHKLLPLDGLTWSFIRPRRPIDRQLAYAESSWICQFIEQAYGHGAILGMLDQFRAGKTQEEVFENALHRTQSEFFGEFDAWCQKQVGGWGYDLVSSAKYQVLRDQGEALIQAREYAKAVPIFEQIAALRPVDMLPHQRLAGLYMNRAVGEPKRAAEQLDILAAVELNNNMYTKGAARMYRQTGDYDKAAARALKAVYIDPYDTDAHRLLLDLYEKLGNTAGAARETRVIGELEHWQENAADADSAHAATQAD
jgi:tetratricopeptide (TPR) repeat protein